MADRETAWARVRRRVWVLVLVTSVRLALWVLPFRLARRLFDRAPAPDAPSDARRAVRVAHEIRWASRRVPRATCFTQALAARIWLARLGVANDLRIGVARNATGGPEAHAWIEVAGLVVLGNLVDLQRFAPLPDGPSAASSPPPSSP